LYKGNDLTIDGKDKEINRSKVLFQIEHEALTNIRNKEIFT